MRADGDMLKNLFFGGSLAFAAAIQPGPLQAFLISRAAATGWRRTLPACLSPLLSDVPIALLALLVLGRLPATIHHLLRASGGFLLLYLAWIAVGQWRHPEASASLTSAPRTLLEAALVNLLNPNPYLAWMLVLGPSVLAAWHERPRNAIALVTGFYGTMVTVLGLLVFLLGMSRFLGSRTQRVLLGASALALAGLGIYLLAAGLRGLGAV